MKNLKSIEVMYNIINQRMGPIEAKNFVSEVLYNAISELQEDGKQITGEEIEKKLSKKALEYLKVSENNVA